MFMGREEEMGRLHKRLVSAGKVAITQPQAITGLGGVGKTRLAVEYAWRRGGEYTAVIFASADSKENLFANLALAGGPKGFGTGVLGIDGWEQGQTQETQLGLVFDWLAGNTGWLLILDNVDSDEAANLVMKVLLPLRM